MLQSVAFVVRVDSRLSALDHVHYRINAFLDVSTLFSLLDAAKKGDTSMFQHVLHRILHDCDVDPLLRYHWLSKALEKAIKRGNLGIAKLIHGAHPAPLAVKSFRIAVDSGQLEMLQWLHQNRCDGLCIDVPPAHKDIPSMRCCLAPPFMRFAREIGRVRVLRWLYETGYGDKIVAGVGDVAARCGDMEMVQWLHDHSIPRAFTARAVDGAAQHGHLEILQYLHERGYKGFASEVLMDAIVGGFTQVAAYLQQHEICTVLDPQVLVLKAAKCGRIDLLQARSDLLADDAVRENVMDAAVSYGQLHVATWLAPCLIKAQAVRKAAYRGDLTMLQWIQDCGYGEWDHFVMSSAAMEGQLKVLEWLHHVRPYLFPERDAMQGAVGSGDLATIKWLHALGGHIVRASYILDATANGRFEIAKWLYENQETTTSHDVELPQRDTGLAATIGCGHLEEAMWLHQKGYTRGELTRETSLAVAPDAQMWLCDVLGFPITQELLNRTASHGDLALLKWLCARSDFRVDDSKHVHLNQWLQDNDRNRVTQS